METMKKERKRERERREERRKATENNETKIVKTNGRRKERR